MLNIDMTRDRMYDMGVLLEIIEVVRESDPRMPSQRLEVFLVVLRRLAHDQPVDYGTLVEVLGIPKASVSRNIIALCDIGWLDRVQDIADTRRYIMRVGREGAKFLDRFEQIIQKRYKK